MTASNMGLQGALAIKARFGIEFCSTCGQPKLTGFYSRNGQKGAAKQHAVHTRSQFSEWGKQGGRGKKKYRGTNQGRS